MRLASALALLLAAGPALAAPPKPVSVSIGDGAVVSPASGTLYVMDPKDGIVAVDLATNRTKWAAKGAAAKPLAEVGRALVGLDERGAIRVLDAATGRLRARCSTIAGLTLELADGLGSSQSSSGASDGRRAWITWARATHYAGGAAPTPAQEEASRSHASGVFEVDPAACRGRASTSPWAPRITMSRPAQWFTPAGTGFRVSTATMRLQRTRGGKPLPPIDLRQGRTARSLVSVTPDLRHVLVAEFDGKAYPGAVFEIETGRVVARATFPFFPAGALLVGRRLIMGGGAVFVFDLDTQKVLWTRALRSTAYAGPYPPSAAP